MLICSTNLLYHMGDSCRSHFINLCQRLTKCMYSFLNKQIKQHKIYQVICNASGIRKVWRYQTGSQKLKMEKGSTIQWPKEQSTIHRPKRGQTLIYKRLQQKNYRSIDTSPTKTGDGLRCFGRVCSSCSTCSTRGARVLLLNNTNII